MKPMKKHRSDEGAIILAGLPEQVLRQIFRYIGTYELFHTLRTLNQRVKKLVDEYLRLQGVFMLIRGQNNRYIYIFKREGKYFKTFSIGAPPFPISHPFLSHPLTQEVILNYNFEKATTINTITSP